MKSKTKAPTGAKCTSTVSGGALRCVIEGDHQVHSTKTKRGGQFSTWQLIITGPKSGRYKVTAYDLKGKVMGEWDEDAPAPKPRLCPSCGGTQCKPNACLYAMNPSSSDDGETDDPFEDEVRSDEDRDLARKMREEREAHARELDAGAKADLAKVFGDDGEPPKAKSRQKHDDSGVVIEVGARVRMARLDNGEIGVVREVVDTKRGRRALVGWADSEQFVDLVALVVVEPTPAATPRPVKFSDLCLKCGLTKHAGKCAQPEKVAAPAPTLGPKILGYRRHPVAAAYPLLDGAAFEEFADLIAGSGLRDDIVLVEVDGEKWILDGSNRALACERRKVEPRFTLYTGATDIESLKSYSIDKNGAGRRHLDPSIRAMIASELADLGPGKPQQRETGRASGLTQGEAGKRLGVSDRLVRRARVVRENGTAKVKEAVMRGKLAVEAAEQVSKLPASEQDEIADEALAKKDGTAAVRTGRVRSLVKQKEKRATVRKINEGRVMPMPLGPFGVIYGDYPWLFENSDQHEGSRGHMSYPPMSLDEIIAHARETRSRAAENCILALWTTNWHIIKQMPQVLDAYGAAHRTVITWPKDKAGVGSWPRGQTEHLVIAEIGKTTHTLNELTTLLEQYAVREHSRKPDEVAELLLKHCSGPHLELFAREPRSGWIAWGAETKKFAAEAA